MSKKIPSADIDYACEEVVKGVMVKTIAQKLGVCPSTLRRHFRERGIKVPHTGKKPLKYALPEEEIVALYQAGTSEKEIAKRFSVSRNVIRKRLVAKNVSIRNESQANLFRYRNTTKEYRQSLTQAANDAVRGVSRSHEKKIREALSREKTGKTGYFGPGEAEVAGLLDKLGIAYARQKAIDVYNVDFAFGSIAMEITCGTVKYRGGNVIENKRLKKLVECGYKPLCIEFSQKEAILPCLDDLIPILQEASSNPPPAGQYWMVRCYRKNTAVIRNDLGQFTSIETPEQFFCKRKTVKL